MSVPKNIDILLQRWEELREQGQTPSPADVCQDTPELLPEVQKRIDALEAMDRILGRTDPTVGWTGDQTPLPQKKPLPRFPGYELLGELRRGGMGLVYKARHLRLNRVVAIKMIRFCYDKATAQRFYAEARILAQLQHPHIVQIHDVGEFDGQLYFAMELMEGGNLAQKLAQRRYSPVEAAELMKILAHTVQAAHAKKIIHRDLKPSNFLLTGDGTPKIADFGLAKNLDQDSGTTRSGDILGTPSYMAPEQAAGDNKKIGPAADLYALGATLYEILTGQPPFARDVDWWRISDDQPPPPSRLRPGIPRPLEIICLHCLHKQPEKRYSSAQALADDLDNFLRGEPIQARPPGWLERSRHFFRRRIGWNGTLLLMILVLTVWACWQVVQPREEAPEAILANMQRDLKAGKTASLLKPDGSPKFARWWGNQGNVIGRDQAGEMTLNCFNYPFLELLPSMPTAKYRFRAQIWHSEANVGDTKVGIFFGLTPLPAKTEGLFACWTLSFNDVVLFKAPPQSPQGNMLSLLYMVRPWKDQAITPPPQLGGTLKLFSPHAKEKKEKLWRTLEIEVTPESYQIRWENEKPITRSAKALIKSFQNQLSQHWPDADVAFVEKSLTGGLGVFINQGVASFKNLIVEPLP